MVLRNTGGKVLDTDTKTLFSTYNDWAADNNEPQVTRTMFGLMLSERGFEKDRDSRTGRNIWRGLCVKSDDADSGMSFDDDDQQAIRLLEAV